MSKNIGADDLAELLNAAIKPRYPAGPVWLSDAAIGQLAEQIACVGLEVTDEQGRSISARGDATELMELARATIEKWMRVPVTGGGPVAWMRQHFNHIGDGTGRDL